RGRSRRECHDPRGGFPPHGGRSARRPPAPSFGGLMPPRFANSFAKDRSVKDHQFAPGTVRRVLSFARPYRRLIAAFLALVIADALVGASVPLLYRAIIDDGIQQDDRDLVVVLASVVAGLAVASAAIGLTQRWFSARIGE